MNTKERKKLEKKIELIHKGRRLHVPCMKHLADWQLKRLYREVAGEE